MFVWWQLGLMALTAVAGYCYWQHWFGRYPLKPNVLPALMLISMVLALAGGHAAYLIAQRVPPQSLGYYLLTDEGWRAGYLSLGQLVGFGLALALTAWLFRCPLLYLADIATPAIFSVIAVWRLGCFFHGCCFGTPTELPWGVRFPIGADPALQSPPLHPTQLYEALLCSALFLLTPLVIRWLATTPGKGLLAICCIGAYSAVRLLVDHFRVGASIEPAWAGLSMSQIIATGALLVCAITASVIAWRQKRIIADA